MVTVVYLPAGTALSFDGVSLRTGESESVTPHARSCLRRWGELSADACRYLTRLRLVQISASLWLAGLFSEPGEPTVY